MSAAVAAIGAVGLARHVGARWAMGRVVQAAGAVSRQGVLFARYRGVLFARHLGVLFARHLGVLLARRLGVLLARRQRMPMHPVRHEP